MSNVIGILFDELGSQIQCQIVRDLMILKGKWEDIELNSQDLTTISIAQSLDIPITSQPPIMYIVYRVKDWPRVPAGVKRVNRDLKVTEADIGLDPNPKIGYYLPQQGRDGANLTERYLNRNAPRGKGLVDPMLMLIWGSI